MTGTGLRTAGRERQLSREEQTVVLGEAISQNRPIEDLHSLHELFWIYGPVGLSNNY
jgi:hypothetical protein